MADDEKKDPALGEVNVLRADFDSAMHVLRGKQRSAVERVVKAVDKRKIAKIRKTLDGLQS